MYKIIKIVKYEKAKIQHELEYGKYIHLPCNAPEINTMCKMFDKLFLVLQNH